MITTSGKSHIKRYLAGYVPAIAGSIALGIGSTAESLLDANLQFEFVRSDVRLVTYNFATNKLIFKTTIPDSLAAQIYEVAVFSSTSDNTGVAYGSRLISTFSQVDESWRKLSNDTPVSYAVTGSRIGNDALLHTPVASASETSYLRNLNFDFSQNTAADKFTIAFSVINANTSSVQLKLMTDASNYYSYTFSSAEVGSIGYKVLSRTKATATVTGAPNWSQITELQLVTTSTAGGQSDVEFDGIRIDNPNDYGLDNILVARKVITPVTKVAGQPQDLEFSLDINI